MSKYLIGYVDEQRGERLDFSNLMEEDQDFAVVNFEVNDTSNFQELLEEILNSEIDCLVVDYHLSETGVQFEGSTLIEEFHKIKPLFPKIIYTAKEDKVIPIVDNEIIYLISDKEIKGDEKRGSNFRLKLKSLIINYQNDIAKNIKCLEDLSSKRKSNDLTKEEENSLFESKQFLMKLDTRKIDLPSVVNNKDYVDQLEEVNKKVDDILNEMRNA
jgi:hypothetical protein